MKKLLLMMGLLFVIFLAACSNGGEKATSDGSSSNGGKEQAEVKIISHFFGPTPPSKDSQIEQEIEKGTNTELNIEWVSANNYGDKFNVMLASGELPDLMLVPDPFNPVFRQAAEQGAFWDIKPYIDDYPNIKEGIDDIAWDLTKMNGANYVIPRPRPTDGEAFFILRKDWLDKVGLDVPTTSDELYKVMNAFTHNDPDGDGKDNTVGFVSYVGDTGMGGFASFEGMFTGVNGEWALQDGKLVHSAFLPGTRDAIEYLAKAYSDGLIAADFASLQISQTKENFIAGKAGIFIEKSGALQEVYDPISQIESGFDFKNLLPLTSINGYNPKGTGFSGGNAIPKSVPEEKMKKILEMIDRWMEDDVFTYQKQGIEGIHHTVENGKVVIDTEKTIKEAIGEYNQIVYVSDPYASTVKPTFPEDVQQLYSYIQDERAKSSVVDIGTGLESETGVTYLPELRKDLTDLKTKIILGSEPITAWDDFIEELKNDPKMQQLTKEINESYQNR
ncbi:extracellular solute-binding protein [Bacillus sp. SA1-12]|uniref:extracellular solute-binding protein n=1 Tax=Bacillus sp. SA1-12 TaxID=1455638 RepID=UPI000A07D9F7|nr:extracellular solute-binding protein [Bacillus sp. SA1-12]